MNDTSFSQFYSFLIFIGIGILIVLIFDIFRICRKSFKTPDIITFVEDIAFGLIVGFILLYSILKFNSGELRLYIFLGLIIGGIVYTSTASKLFIKANILIINCIKIIINTIFNIIIFPVKMLIKFARKAFLKPISFFFFNLKKKFTKISKKYHFKKGF